MNGRTRAGAAAGVALLLAGIPTGAAGQAVLEEFTYDSLRPSGIQFDLGALGSADLERTLTGGVRLDAGRIAPRVRVLLGLSYFRSDFDAAARSRFEQRIRDFVIDPAGDDTIRVGEVRMTSITGDLDLQYVLPQGRVVTAYLGLGVGVQYLNGGGPAIDGTFIEDGLDGVAACLNVTVGAEFAVARHWRLTLDGRGALSSELSTVSLRGGVMYR
ncbi:MAG: hypothetical protein ACREMV_06050, partial [Gemmatimonadales bacterium]